MQNTFEYGCSMTACVSLWRVQLNRSGLVIVHAAANSWIYIGDKNDLSKDNYWKARK